MNSMIGFGLLNLLIGLFSFWRFRCSIDTVTRGQFKMSFIVSAVIVLAVAGTEGFKHVTL
jgi:hypothetical protein